MFYQLLSTVNADRPTEVCVVVKLNVYEEMHVHSFKRTIKFDLLRQDSLFKFLIRKHFKWHHNHLFIFISESRIFNSRIQMIHFTAQKDKKQNLPHKLAISRNSIAQYVPCFDRLQSFEYRGTLRLTHCLSDHQHTQLRYSKSLIWPYFYNFTQINATKVPLISRSHVQLQRLPTNHWNKHF